MAAKTPSARRRASFARAERINRTNGTATTPQRKDAGRVQSQKPAQPPARQQKPVQASNSAALKRSARSNSAVRVPTSIDVVSKRVQQARQATEQRRHRQLKEQTRQTFIRAAERRRDEQKRTEFARRREIIQANLKRAQEVRKRTEQRQRQQLQERTRQTFNTQTGFEKEVQRRATEAKEQVRIKEAGRRAAVAIDREQKSRMTDQQAAHRYQTDQIRLQHRGELQSLKHNLAAGIIDHASRIKGIDSGERERLLDLDRQRRTLTGRLTSVMRPGHYRGQEKAITEHHEAERMRQHRNHEALKERQHQAMQTARLRQGHERLHVFAAHRVERQQMLEQQQLNRPRMIEDRQRTLIEVERQRTLEHERTNDRQHTDDRSWHIPAKVY